MLMLTKPFDRYVQSRSHSLLYYSSHFLKCAYYYICIGGFWRGPWSAYTSFLKVKNTQNLPLCAPPPPIAYFLLLSSSPQNKLFLYVRGSNLGRQCDVSPCSGIAPWEKLRDIRESNTGHQRILPLGHPTGPSKPIGKMFHGLGKNPRTNKTAPERMIGPLQDRLLTDWLPEGQSQVGTVILNMLERLY